jgi:hypothetical protein
MGGFFYAYVFYYKFLIQTPFVNGAVFAPVALAFIVNRASRLVVFPEIPFFVNAVINVTLAFVIFNEPS